MGTDQDTQLKNMGCKKMEQKTYSQEMVRKIHLLQKPISQLDKHDLLSHVKEIKALESVRLNPALSNEEDLKEYENQLYELYEKTHSELNTYFEKQDQFVKLISISWLSSIGDMYENHKVSEWALLVRASTDDTDHQVILVDGGHSQTYSLSQRLYYAFIDYPNETVEAVGFASYMQDTLVKPYPTYINETRIKNYLTSYTGLILKEGVSTLNQSPRYFEVLKFYLSKDSKSSKSFDFIIAQIILMDHYWKLESKPKEALKKSIKNLRKIIALDHQMLASHKNSQVFLNAAERYLSPSKRFEKLTDIAEQIDSTLRFSLDSLQQRKKIYSDIIKTYQSTVTPFPATKPISFSLSDKEHDLLEDLCKATDSSSVCVLREAIKHAQDRCKTHKEDPAIEKCITATRAGTKSKTFKLNSADLQAIQRLTKSISSTKLPLPRKPNQSLTVGIAIRLYAESKRRRPCVYTGERVRPILGYGYQ